MGIKIQEISAADTWELRQKVMWPEKHISYVKLEDDMEGIHYGLYKNNQLVSVVSLFIDNNRAQFRKFATDEFEQGNGYGSKLLLHLITVVRNKGVSSLWCNARLAKAAFYEKFGLKVIDGIFIKGEKEYVVMAMDLESEL